MWSKITSALKPHQPVKDMPIPAKEPSQSEVLNKVFEQHPNMSMFHANETGIVDRSPSPPPSPSIHGKRNMFKRMSRAALKEDLDVQRAPSPFIPPSSIPKKVRDQPDNVNGSQHSLRSTATDSKYMPRRSSFDMLRPSPPRPDTTRSVKDSHRRPSIDFLRQETARISEENSRPSNTSQEVPLARSSSLDMLSSSPEAQYPQDSARFAKDSNSRPSMDFLRAEAPNFNRAMKEDNEFLSTPPGLDKFGSKRSILRDRNTPGTGQNVRFIGRDAYKVITPDHSLSTELQNKPQPPLPQETPFVDRLTQSNTTDSPQSLGRSQSPNSSKSPRPTVAEIFAPLLEAQESAPANTSADQSSASLSSYNHFVVTENSNLFDVSQQLDIPSFPPPGLDFDVDAPMFDTSGGDSSQLLADGGIVPYSSEGMTSTPYRPQDIKGKGKEKASDPPTEEVKVPAPVVIDETIFHAKEKSPKFAAPLHERSQSFSLGQTLFYSMANSGGDATKSALDNSAAYPSSELKPESLNSSMTAPTPPSVKSRGRAMSDTVFQSMLRSPPPKIVGPEADINDESSSGLVVYSAGEPDPFSAHANTYYTPQSMIPTTPPKGAPRQHNRKTSKEESLIISLQTQLALRNELCSQYEADLKARDELVEVLGKKLSDAEKEEAKRKAALRSWKRKVQDLEKACRQLEEAVEDSRQMSMERSVMDEASSEALRMLHRQIASLEKEKGEWVKRETTLREEVETLESLVRERSEDVMNLKEHLWSRDESERELKEGIREAKEQIDMMGNISVGAFDEEELKRLLMEKEQKTAEETQRFRTAEFELKQELADMKMKCEGLEVQKASREEQLENVNQLLKTREEEYAVLKSELEAQWQHTESASEKMQALEKEKSELERERDEFRADIEELETRMSHMELEWQESENRRTELDNELQEVWNAKDALEKERNELEDTLHQDREHIVNLEHDLEERDHRISEQEQEHQFANDNIARLQENLYQRDAEILQHTQRVLERETDAERLREEMSTLKREYQRLLNEQSRALEDVSGQQDETQHRMDEIVKEKAAVDIELKTAKERVVVLKEEVERLRRQIHTFQQESADKEVKIVQLEKQHNQAKEDNLGLNIALDSKQQELELIKRKMGLRGTAGSTPAQPSKIAHRRDSSVFSATPISRPPSVISDTDREPTSLAQRKERKNSTEAPQSASAKMSALGKSSRINAIGGGSSASATKPFSGAGASSSSGSMGPPALKPRASMASTPTPVGRATSALGRSSSARATPQSITPVPHRRVSSVEQQQTPMQKANLKSGRASVSASPAPSSVAEVDEKENVDTTSTSMKKRTIVPVPA